MANKFNHLAPKEMMVSVHQNQEAFDNVTRWEEQLAQIEGEFSDLYRLLDASYLKEYEGGAFTKEDEEDRAIIQEKIESLVSVRRKISTAMRETRNKFSWTLGKISTAEKFTK